MKLRHIIIALLILVAGVLVWLFFAQRISPDEYHTDPIEAFLDADLYGGSKKIEALPALKPFLYLNDPGGGNGFLLNVLIPVPEGTSIGSPTFDSPVAGTLRVKYRAESGDPTGTTDGLFHQTLIPVAANVDTVVVECVMDGGGTGTSTIGTSDSDHEDPISGGPSTPYMSHMGVDGLMLYNGDHACDASVTLRSGTVTNTTVPAEPEFQRFDPGATDFTLFTVGKRDVKGVR